MNAAGGQYVDPIQQTKNKFEAKGEVATADDLIEGMCEKFRISGSGCHNNDNASANETALTAAGKTPRRIRGRCYICDQEGHRAADCPEKRGQGNNGKEFHGKCHECGRSGHKKADCWELAENAHKRPAGYKPRSGQDAAGTMLRY